MGGGEVAAAEFSVRGVKGRIDRSVTVFTVNAVESNIHHIPSRTLGKKDEEGERRMKKEEEGGRRRVIPVGVSTSSHVTVHSAMYTH